MKKFAALWALAALLFAGQAHAGLVTAQNPEAILSVAKEFGEANLEKDSDGDPKIVGKLDGRTYVIYFYGCTKGLNCKDIVLRAGWGDTKMKVEDMNRWNSETRFGKAYLDKDGDPTVEMVINLKGGVSRENLYDTFDFWRVVVDKFEAIIE